jgi:hypothetical protein
MSEISGSRGLSGVRGEKHSRDATHAENPVFYGLSRASTRKRYERVLPPRGIEPLTHGFSEDE